MCLNIRSVITAQGYRNFAHVLAVEISGRAHASLRNLAMKKLFLTAALLAGSCGFVLAQGAGTEPPKKSDKPPAVQVPGLQTEPVAMKKKKKKAPAKSTKQGKETGTETGTAKDPAGPAGMRESPGGKK
jgi:hypothetical protein